MVMSVRDALARMVDIFGPQGTWDPTQLYGNLMVSPGGNVLVGSITDDLLHKLQVNGTTKLGGTGLVYPDGTAASSAQSNQNLIINGAALVQQSSTIAVAAGATLYGGVDRFKAINGAATGAFSQAAGTMTIGSVTKPCVIQTVTTVPTSLTGTNYWSGVLQMVEGFNAYRVLGQPLFASLYFYTNVSGTFTLAVRDSTGANSFVSTFTATAGTAVKVAIPLAAVPTSAVVPAINGVGLQVTIGALNLGTYQAAAQAGWQTGNLFCASTATNWAATVGNFIAVTELQLEVGTINTPFDHQKYSEFLEQCQRYYQVVTVQGLNGMTYTSNGDTRCTIPLHTKMRVAATGISCSETALNVIGFGVSTGNVCTLFTNVSMPIGSYQPSVDVLRIASVTTTNLTAGGNTVIWSSSDSPTFYLSSEL
jgi:hypothetical protein